MEHPLASPLAEAHTEAQSRLRHLIANAVARAWRELGAWNEGDAERFVAQVVPVILAGQRGSIALTDAFLAQTLGRPPLGVHPGDLMGAAVRNGAAPQEVYHRPFVTLWSSLGDGKPFADGFSAGLARATASAEMDVQLSMRATANAVQQADDAIFGYQRVADGGACEFCAEINGAYVKSADAFPLHNRCGCGLEPLTAPHPRAAYLPSGEAVGDTYAIREHGELGPVLVSPTDNFKSEAEIPA